MTSQSDDLPVLVIDGADFSDFDGFACEFSRLFRNYVWRGNLDAFNDLLRGGFGTPETGWVLRWLNSATSRAALGYETLHCRNAGALELRGRLACGDEGARPLLGGPAGAGLPALRGFPRG